MPELYTSPTRIPVPGGKLIEEHVGRVNSDDERISIAHMTAPANWSEPFQTPAFDEWTLVLRGSVVVEHDGGRYEVDAGQSTLVRAGERIRYSCGDDGAEYVAVCLPAFAPGTVNREDEQ